MNVSVVKNVVNLQRNYFNKDAIKRNNEKKTLLLDFDGVIMRNNGVMKKVEEASTHYCMRYMKNVSFDYAREFNRLNYAKYGHTVVMLKEVFGVEATLDEYNDIVFGEILNYKEIKGMLTNEDMKHAELISKVISDTRGKGGICSIFTNGCSKWIFEMNKLIGMEADFTNDLYSCDILPRIKPDNKAYRYVEKELRKKNAVGPYYFIDDSKKNLRYCEETLKNMYDIVDDETPVWIPILYTGNDDIFYMF